MRRYVLVLGLIFVLCGCGSRNNEPVSNDNDKVINNEPILNCHIDAIDDSNVCSIYFDNGLVSKIVFTSLYSSTSKLNEAKEVLEASFGEVVVNNMEISLEIDSSNDKYLEYIGMDRESIGYICR